MDKFSTWCDWRDSEMCRPISDARIPESGLSQLSPLIFAMDINGNFTLEDSLVAGKNEFILLGLKSDSLTGEYCQII